MSSSRLPGKVLADLGPGRTLDLVLARLQAATQLDQVVLATSYSPDDEPVVAVGGEHGIEVVRGPLEDVLERFAIAAREVDADAIVRITADCPLVDPDLVDEFVAMWRREGVDYLANIVPPRTFPKGLDVEVMTREALECAAIEANKDADREHVTPFIRRHSGRFSIFGVYIEPSAASLRITLDTEDDLVALRALIAHIGPHARMRDALAAANLPTRFDVFGHRHGPPPPER